MVRALANSDQQGAILSHVMKELHLSCPKKDSHLSLPGAAASLGHGWLALYSFGGLLCNQSAEEIKVKIWKSPNLSKGNNRCSICCFVSWTILSCCRALSVVVSHVQ